MEFFQQQSSINALKPSKIIFECFDHSFIGRSASAAFIFCYTGMISQKEVGITFFEVYWIQSNRNGHQTISKMYPILP